MFTRVLLVKLFIFIMNCDLLETVIVNTNVGKIRGVKTNNFTGFLGIPYGVVDHTNPFAPAEPYPVFKTIYDALQYPEVCAQIYDDVPQGSLDCLNLNVFTSNQEIQGLQPVMVFIHGGAFIEGHGNEYPPTFLVRRGVIVVTMNYRLGPYACLCLKQTQYYNNQGFNDQRLALRWVKSNIEGFGGDPNNILLFGHSSGSITVNYHLIYNNNLFNKAILQSGVLISPVNYVDSELDIEIARKLKIDVVNNGNADSFIRNLSNYEPLDLIKAVRGVISRRICLKDVDKESIRNLKNIKLLIGNTDKESGFTFNEVSDAFFRNFNFRTALLRGFYNATDEMQKEVKAFYYKNDVKEDVIDFASDFFYIYPTERTIKLHLDHGATVYRYVFSFNGHRNAMKERLKINYTGAIHADELGYMFDLDILKVPTSEDKYMIDKLTQIWTDFAKYGYPLDRDTGHPYPATNMITKPYILLDLPVRTGYVPFDSRMKFWDKFYELYGRYSKGFDYFNRIAKENYSNGLPVESKANRDFVTLILAVTLILIYVLV